MPDDIYDPDYWHQRLKTVVRKEKPLHYTVYEIVPELWQPICDRHKELLAEHVQPGTRVLDVGCGYGRLLDLMPPKWERQYLGADICPAFIAAAKRRYPDREFVVADIRLDQFATFPTGDMFDLAVLVSVRGMILREKGPIEWANIANNLLRSAKQLLCLEYDADDKGLLIGKESSHDNRDGTGD